MKQIRMLPGAPPDDQLQVRFTCWRDYEANPTEYKKNEDTSEAKDQRFVDILDGTLLGCARYDALCQKLGYYMPDEILNFQDVGWEYKFELVDAQGNVWTEEYDDGQPDPDAFNCPTCGSHSPALHPALQADGGEVQPCSDEWHKTA